MMAVANSVVVVMALPVVLSCVYLLVLTLLSAETTIPTAGSTELRFDIIVPAHNEASIVARTIDSLKCIDWPADGYRIIVVADNCTDETARVAVRAGAHVSVRHDLSKRGKGHALQFAFDASRSRGWADAVVVVDADSDVSPNILTAFAARIANGAGAVQAHYGVRNSMTSWRTRLLTIATTSFTIVRSRARERLNLSCGIRGNGWCVTHRLLDLVPYRAYSLAEDIEYGIDLGREGQRVAYADEAHAYSDMVASAAIARVQRQRWEQGRFQLLRSEALPLLARAIGSRSTLCLDLGLDLLLLPLSYVLLGTVALAGAAAAGSLLHWTSAGLLWMALGCVASLALHVCRGWQLSGVGVQGVWDLARVPWFVIWKLGLGLRSRKSGEWIKTQRERH